MPESHSTHEALAHSQAAASPGAPLRVFVATDLSELGMAAVRRGHEIALAARGRLAVCHVQEPHDRRTRGLRSSEQWRVFGPPGDPGVARLELDGTIGSVTGRRPEDLDVFIERGSPAEEILRGARRWKSDLIVLSGQRRRFLRGMLGSVTERVVRCAPCPVLVVKSGSGAGGVLAATDLTDPAFPVVHAGAREARRLGLPLTVVHAIPFVPTGMLRGHAVGSLSPMGRGELRRAFRGQLDRALDTLSVKAAVRVEDGEPADVVARLSEALSATLVVVGTRGRGGFWRLLLGSVAEEIVSAAPCSVLVVHLSA